MWKKLWRISSLKYIAAFLIPAIFVMLINQGLDNDSWYVLAEGRYIAENGIYYTDVLSMHDGLNVVVQNYGFAVIFYWIFSVFGAPGIYTMMLILNFLICYLLYKICMTISDKNTNLSLAIMIVTDLVFGLGFVVTRAQMVSYVIFLALILILELYIKNKKTKYLWWIPVLSIIQINLHASLWLMLFLVMITYIIDSVNKLKLKLQGYKTWPLVVVGAISFLVGLINPYGIRMMTFVIPSYSNPVLKNLVVELEFFSPFSSMSEAVICISIVVVSFLCVFAKKRKIRIRYFLMFFGFLVLGLNTVKSLGQFILVMFFPLAYLYKDIRIERVIYAQKARNVVCFWCSLLTVCLSAVLLFVVNSSIKAEPDDYLVAAVDAIDSDINKKEEGTYKAYTVYTGYNDGGYLEYRGYKPYIDPRGEYFIEKVNGKEDILKEYVDFMSGKITIDEMLDKYNFDYVLINGENDSFYRWDSKRCEELYNNEEHEIRVCKIIKEKE